MRALGALRFSQGSTPTSPSRNDPALTINQIQTNVPIPSATNHVRDYAKEKEFQTMKSILDSQHQEKEMLRNKLLAFKEKEKKLHDQITGLEKLIAQLRLQLKEKTENCQELQSCLKSKTQEFEANLSNCKKEHDETKNELELSLQTNKDLRMELEAMKAHWEAKIKTITMDHEKHIKDLTESKNKELKEKDDRLAVLKQRMAETLGKNSMERQHQLEELKKDLVKQAQEARDLQQKLKHIQVKSKQCENCEKLEAMLEDKVLQLRLKEKAINDLQGIGRKMQIQLHQQDIILQKWEERENRNGY
uniref:Coiled-coil domain-containing protein 136-like n=1 Tax=Phallusia mammillata TaxID=59560 RepID=A0A6F9D7W3_9ASCI|nr:coiled-coil domain-containing protein 136-like [Phallusia mammillata]